MVWNLLRTLQIQDFTQHWRRLHQVLHFATFCCCATAAKEPEFSSQLACIFAKLLAFFRGEFTHLTYPPHSVGLCADDILLSNTINSSVWNQASVRLWHCFPPYNVYMNDQHLIDKPHPISLLSWCNIVSYLRTTQVPWLSFLASLSSSSVLKKWKPTVCRTTSKPTQLGLYMLMSDWPLHGLSLNVQYDQHDTCRHNRTVEIILVVFGQQCHSNWTCYTEARFQPTSSHRLIVEMLISSFDSEIGLVFSTLVMFSV